MREPTRIEACASELLDAARELQSAAAQPGSHIAAPDALVSLEEALQIVSAAWYQVAADAVRLVVDRRDPGLSREAEVQLLGTLHDVAAAFARCARACRDGSRVVTPIIARAAARRAGDTRPAERVA